jgi:hypothetical protein
MPQDANLVLPATQVIAFSPVHTITKKTVILDPEDCHDIGGKKMLSKPQIMELLNNANGKITKSFPLPSDHPDIASWQCSGEIKTPDGQTLAQTQSYTLDMRYKERPNEVDGSLMNAILLNKLRAARKIKNGSWKWSKGMPKKDAEWAEWAEWARDGALTELKQIDRFRTQRVETGAMLRVARALLNLKSTYKEEEVKRPWIVYSATFDMTKAMKVGGPFAEMAKRAFSGVLSQSLGLSQEYANQMLLSAESAVEGEGEQADEDLFLLNEEEREKLANLMLENGWKDRRQIDKWMGDLFGESFSSVTVRHRRLIIESFEILYDASENMANWNSETVSEFKEHLRYCMVLAFAEGTSIVEVMDQRWYDVIYNTRTEEEIQERLDQLAEMWSEYADAVVDAEESEKIEEDEDKEEK